jgi:uncharacterized protein related to proFAR isomerase
MLKILLNLVLNLLLGSLKRVLLLHIEEVNAENLTNAEKRQAVFDKIKADSIKEGKVLRDSLLNLAIETGVQLIKDKLK